LKQASDKIRPGSDTAMKLNAVLILMLAVYMIYFVQFILSASKELLTLGRLPYAQRLDLLDKEYYRNTFYGYYAWLDTLLPSGHSFSILFDGSVDDIYLRYERKLNYYLYPRYVLPGEKKLLGYADKNVRFLRGTSDIKDLRYSDLVLALKNKNIHFRSKGGLKYIVLNNKSYYLVSVLDNKGLLAERSFIRNDVRKNNEWANLRSEFKKLYGIDMTKAAF
jgi:hypothetical protein